MDFQLNEEQLQLKKTVREFAEREIKPHVMEWDEAGEFPLATVKELGKLGLMGTVFPPEYGGAGMGYVEYATIIEELSRKHDGPGGQASLAPVALARKGAPGLEVKKNGEMYRQQPDGLLQGRCRNGQLDRGRFIHRVGAGRVCRIDASRAIAAHR